VPSPRWDGPQQRLRRTTGRRRASARASRRILGSAADVPRRIQYDVGTTEVADQAARTKHEVDVIALANRRDDLLLVDLPTLFRAALTTLTPVSIAGERASRRGPPVLARAQRPFHQRQFLGPVLSVACDRNLSGSKTLGRACG
jgi:hypothetical protein